jgi:hypothetical protein
MVGQAAASFIWWRWWSAWFRYCERSYRYLHLDAGRLP